MCQACNGIKLRTEPLSELELHRLTRNRETGKVPATPGWYRAHVRAAFALPDLAINQSDPIERVMRTMTTHLTDLRTKSNFPSESRAARMTTAEYVAEIERTWNLKTTTTEKEAA
jgi:hypothetical protein